LAMSMLRPHLLPPISLGQLCALSIGLAVPCVLMSIAIYISYRYRMDFYPEIDLLAFIGFYIATSSAEGLAIFRRYRGLMVAATLVSVISAHGMLLLYKHSPFGPSERFLHDGWLGAPMSFEIR